MVSKLILVNLSFTIIIFLFNVIFGGSSQVIFIGKYFLLSNDLFWNLQHPWVFFSHLFLSNGLIDLIWDMLILYWFGSIIGEMIGDDKILPIYLLGGIFGSILFIILTNLFYSGNMMISGVSTSVISVMVASAILVPEYRIRLLLFGEVSLKLVVIIYVMIKVLYALSSYNTVYFSLAGGIFMGVYYFYSLKKCIHLHKYVNNVLRYIKGVFSFSKSKQKRDLTVKYKSKETFSKKSEKENIKFKIELDRILDKIKLNGYDNLTEAEKEFLFIASNKTDDFN